MKMSIVPGLFALMALALLIFTTRIEEVDAAPSLQLPWPAGQSHRINGGATYGCGYHVASTYNAIDFALATNEEVAATSAGEVKYREDSGDARGIFVEIDHGSGYRSRYLHLSHFRTQTRPRNPTFDGLRTW